MRYGLFTGDSYMLFVTGNACVVTSTEESFQLFITEADQQVFTGVVGQDDIFIDFDCTCIPSFFFFNLF